MGILILLAVLFFLNEQIYRRIAATIPYASISLLRKLFLYHVLFAGIYLAYASGSPTDSKHYFNVLNFLDISWLETLPMMNWGVFFLEYPFTKYLGFDYQMCMLLFSWFGYIGFVYAYLFFTENIKEKVIVFGRYDLLKLLLFLPNMHFWSASLGKGSVIFMGIMMFIYSVQFPKKRIVTLILGAFFIYCIRAHVMFFMIVGVMFGIFFGADRKLSKGAKFFIIISGAVFIYLASNSILAVANLEQSENLVSDFTEFASLRSEGLSANAGSGVDMSSYPLPFKLFTFWFRPLFADAPNVLGFFSSFENLLYLFLFWKICNKSFIKFIRKSSSVVKMSAVIFLLTSFAMTFVMSNLGIIMRQKSQVMYFAFFVIYFYLADKKIKERNYWKQINADTNQEAYEKQNKEFIRFK